MTGVYRNLLLLSLAVYVVCMLVSLADAAPIDDGSIREHRGIHDNEQQPLEEDIQEFDRAHRKRRCARPGHCDPD